MKQLTKFFSTFPLSPPSHPMDQLLHQAHAASLEILSKQGLIFCKVLKDSKVYFSF